MSWEVSVYDPLGVTLVSSAVNGVTPIEFIIGGGTAGGQVGIRGFDPPIVTPPGSGRVLNLYVKQSVMQIPARGIIQFSIDATPVFWGPAVVVPPLTAVGAGPFDQDRDALERVTVLGGEQLLRDTVIGPRLIEEETDVAAIAYELCNLYAHPALTVNVANFPNTGAVLSIYYAPEKTLYDALQGLVDTVPGGQTVCWVDAEGAIHFESFAPAPD